MNKLNVLSAVRAALEAQEFAVDEIEDLPGLKWFMPLSEEYEQDFAIGELFFASDLTDEEMNGIEIAQINLVFKRDMEPERIDALRAFFSRVNHTISGGRFDAQQEPSCYAEYGHDLILSLDETDEQATHKLEAALDLANAYISFAYPSVCGLNAGEMTVQQAMDAVYAE